MRYQHEKRPKTAQLIKMQMKTKANEPLDGQISGSLNTKESLLSIYEQI